MNEWLLPAGLIAGAVLGGMAGALVNLRLYFAQGKELREVRQLAGALQEGIAAQRLRMEEQAHAVACLNAKVNGAGDLAARVREELVAVKVGLAQVADTQADVTAYLFPHEAARESGVLEHPHNGA